MCHFITAVMSPSANADAVRIVAKKHQLRWEPIRNRSIAKLLKPDEGQYYTTWGMCDCGSEIGSLAGGDPLTPDREQAAQERTIRKLHKKGWSQAKIDRRMAQEAAIAERRRVESDHKKNCPGDEVQRWIAFLSELALSKTANFIGLLKHFYNGGIDTEAIIVVKQQSIPIYELSPKLLMSIEDDVLYRFDLRKSPKKQKRRTNS